MKTMNCKQLGGACDKEFRANTFDEIIALSKAHGMDMFQKNDKDHLDAMNAIQELMQKPEEMANWFADMKKKFESLDDD